VLILQDELLAPFILDDRLRQAEIRYLHHALPRRPGRLALIIAATGRLLIAAGTRIEATACRPRPNQTWLLNADLCPDCGN
jgi:hypothetical protein